MLVLTNIEFNVKLKKCKYAVWYAVSRRETKNEVEKVN